MKFFRIDLLTLLISLFILGSCKNPDSIGLPIDPTKALQTNLIDTATIKTTTVLEDSVQTTNAAKAPLAYFKDPVFGTTEANIVASLNLPSLSAYTIPTGTISVDSAVLVMSYADGFYGDSLATSYKVNVYQLNEPISSKAYYNNKIWNFNNTLLGTKTFKPRPKTGFKITTIVTGAKDTLIRVSPQLRIPIDKNFVFNKFFGASSGQLNTNTVFQNYIKGLYITLDKSATSGVGGNIFFNVVADSSRLDVYYHTATGSTIDTEKVSLAIGTPHAAEIKHNFTTGSASADIATQIANPAGTYNTLYIQGLAGLKARLSFPYLKKILAAAQATGGDIVLNRAELVVSPVTGSGIPYVPLPRLTLYSNDIAKQRQLIPDAYAGDLHYISVGSFGGFYDNYHKSYHYIITGYIENLMRGKTIDYGTFIAPTDTLGVSTGTASIDISNTSQVGARTILVGSDKTSAYKMKLNILYNRVTK